ncbi:MAG: sugar phosphate isomerase/epimerase family protein [Bacteroidota bacterium]
MMKKYLTLLLIGFIACQSPQKQQNEEKATAEAEPLYIVPLGIQDYTFRNSFPNGIEATLDTIAEMGFTELEGGPKGDLTPEEYRKLCEDRGIKIVGTGAGFNELEEDPMAVVERAKALGASYVMCAGIPRAERGNFKLEEAQKAVEVFNKAGKVLKENGIIYTYHVHGFEFQPYMDGTLMDYLIQNTNPDDVSFEMDILWTHFGGGDPVALLEKYGDRWKLLHVKDLKKGTPKDKTGGTSVENDVVLGTGELDIPSILKASNKIGIKHMFIEDESPQPSVQVPQSIAYLKSLTY